MDAVKKERKKEVCRSKSSALAPSPNKEGEKKKFVSTKNE